MTLHLKRKYYTIYLVSAIIVGALLWMFGSALHITYKVNKQTSADIIKRQHSQNEK